MLCHRCGSYNSDALEHCTECGQGLGAQKEQSRSQAKPNVATAPFAVDETIADSYLVLGVLARGTSGWMFRARELATQRLVAIKVVSARLIQTEDEGQRFLEQLRRLSKLQHENVLCPDAFAHFGTYYYYCTAFSTGLSLRKVVDLRLEKNQVFGVSEVLPVAAHLGMAVDALGSAGLVHGALRPTNVMVQPDLLRVSAAAHLCGLPLVPYRTLQREARRILYLAPETRDGDTPKDVRTDVFSIAVILGEMLTGVVYGRNDAQWERRLQRMQPAVRRVLLAGLSDDVGGRPSGGRQLYDDLVAAVQTGALDSEPLAERTPQPLDDHATQVDPRSLSHSLKDELSGSSERPRTALLRGSRRQRVAGRRGPGRTAAWAMLGVLSLLLLGWLWWRAQQGAPSPSRTPAPRVETAIAPPVDRVSAPSAVTPLPESSPVRAEPRAMSPLAEAPRPPVAPARALHSPVAPPPPVAPTRADSCLPDMRRIEAGEFQQGSGAKDPGRGFGELPARLANTNAFCIDVFEHPNRRNAIPTSDVSWSAAQALCAKHGKRLCTEAEWERACKGPNGHAFPYGERFSEGTCVVSAGTTERRTMPAGSAGRCQSGFGVFDMSGNVSEWTASPWQAGIEARVVKGGAAASGAATARCSARLSEEPDASDETVGFRCCMNGGD